MSFVNLEDVAGYLGSATVVTQNAFAAQGSAGIPADPCERQLSVSAKFANPRMTTASAMADMGVKMASVRGCFGETDVFLEMMGFDKPTIDRAKAQERAAAREKTIMGIMSAKAPDAV